MRLVKTRFVDAITVTDPDTKLPVMVEIRKLETGEMVGIDGAVLDRLDGDPEVDFLQNPYDEFSGLLIPDDEINEVP